MIRPGPVAVRSDRVGRSEKLPAENLRRINAFASPTRPLEAPVDSNQDPVHALNGEDSGSRPAFDRKGLLSRIMRKLGHRTKMQGLSS